MNRYGRVSFILGVIAAVTQILGCANASQDIAENGLLSNQENANRCTTSGNLLKNTDFSAIDGGGWVADLHGGVPSFNVSSSMGVLQLERIGPEPWMTYRQWADIEGRNTGKLIFTAELKGDLQSQPKLHAFKHVAGLWLQPGGSVRSALVAEHEPNDGVWDWQTVSMEADVVPNSSKAVAGFIHQTGGTLWVRNPRLVWSDCEETPGDAS